MIRAKRFPLLALVAFTAVIVVLLFALGARWDFRAQVEHIIAGFRSAGPLPFFLAMALLPGVGFPLSAFLAIAGPVFGPTMGIGPVVACSIAAITFNVALCYWMAARAMRPLLERIVNWAGYQLPAVSSRTAWPVILILRIVPGIPFCLQSYLLGLARVPFGLYLLISVLVPSAYVTVMITLGDALMRGDRRAMVWAGVLFLAVSVVLHVMRKRLRPAAPVVAVPCADSQRS